MQIEKLDAAGYRKFGLVTAAIVVLLFGLLIPWLFAFAWPTWPWLLAAALALPAVLAPLALGPVYAVWMKFGGVMNWLNTRLILGLVFYGLILPIGILFKLLGRDPLQRKSDPQATSYRNPPPPESEDNMEHPY